MDKELMGIVVRIWLVGIVVVLVGMAGCPVYNVWEREMAGKAELAQAEYNRQVKVYEAQAAMESAKHLANAEIERAKGVAEANRIIGHSLQDNESYLRYLWITNLGTKEGEKEVIYIPTQNGLPILEATRLKK